MKAIYEDRIVKAMTEKFGYKNAMEVPRLDKIVLNMGVGEATQDKKKVDVAAAEMALIAGQKPVITKAKKSVATFKLREGVRVSRPPDHHRSAPRPRLSRPEPQVLRRSWQLRYGPQGAAGVPGN